MRLRVAVLKRSRRALRYATFVICAFAVLLGGLAAVPSGAAKADQTVTAGPFAVTYPGGDVVASYDAPGLAPADASNFLTTVWPEGVGLAAGASLSALFTATWNADASALGSLPEPPTFNGGTATIVSDGAGGSNLTITIPAADVQADGGPNLPSWFKGALAQAAGYFSAAVTWGICEGTILYFTGVAALTPLAQKFCGAVGAATWTAVATIVGQLLNGGPLDSDFWWGALGATVSAFLGGLVVGGYLFPAMGQVFKKTISGLATGLTAILGFLKFLGVTTFNGIISGAQAVLTRVARLFRTRTPAIDLEMGQTPPAASGAFEMLPVPETGDPFTVPAPWCMDAYGVSGDEAAPGQAVAINSCNGNPNQGFDYYPSGMIALYGLCLAPGGGTSSIGTPLLTLEPCDGRPDQEWVQSGTALVNQGGAGCLDDPLLNTTPGTQLDLHPCNGTPAQNWRKPTAAPCDIYAASGTGCAAAYSMDRAMYADYNGPLYQVTRASDGTTADIGLLAEGGVVKASTQDSFCANTSCSVTEIYDQSPNGNNLTIEGPGGAGGADVGANAAALPIKIDGVEAYGLDIEPGTGYRDDSTLGVATSGEPEGMYMVASGTHVNAGCCFDFGNAEANNHDTGNGHMDAVNLSTTCYWASATPCSGSGPWVQADLENGLFMSGSGGSSTNTGNATPFVTAMLQNDGQKTFALEGGDATSGGLTTWYSGSLPTPHYMPMSQEGAVLLGTGGDDSNSSAGSWFEGVMTAGFPGQAANSAVQANIVAAGYAGSTSPVASAAASTAGQAVVHDGYSSVYTVDSANNHLQESYLPAMGDSWSTQDLSATGGTLPGTPPVMPGTEPVSVFHCGYTSVYTVDASSGDLQETYLPAAGFPGDSWVTQDLSVKYSAPPTDTTPTAVVHSAGAGAGSPGCDGYTSVYTVDRDGDLQETYLPNQGFPGDGWVTQDLSGTGGSLPGTPQVLPGTAPVAVVHCGYTSVYTVDAANHDLQETYLPTIGGPWSTQDLSAKYGAPVTDTTPTAVVHSAGADAGSGCDAYTSVYTVDQAGRDLQETFLPNAGFPGDAWRTQDLSAIYHTPAVAPGTQPEALVHMGYTSVYTTDQGSGDVEETYLPAVGQGWHYQDLSANYHTPVTDQSPIVLLHPDTSGNLDWASVFTVGEFNAHLQETYLPNTGFPGDAWAWQDLSAKYSVPPVYVQQGAAAGWSAVHDGYTSAYTIDASDGHLDESYLPAMGRQWAWQDLSAKYQAPAVKAGTVPVALYHDGYTSVYTVDASNSDLQETYLPGAASTGVGWTTQDLSAGIGSEPVATGSSPAAVFHDGYTSVFTVDPVGDLRETYLPAAGFPGDAWQTQNLTVKYNAPDVMGGTSPVAIVHDGYVSVYTIDAGDSTHAEGDLQETFLPFMGAGWLTQDLSAEFGTPPSHVTPAAVFHDGYVSVYTVGSQGDLQETFLPAMGDGWLTQDLTANSGVPKALNVAPTALYHDGYTSVYYLSNPGDHLTEAYLPAISGPWHWQDLSANTSVPASVQSPSALVHYDTSGGLTYASVYTTDASTGDLRETYLPDAGFPGDAWVTQDLSAKYLTPVGLQGGGRVVYAPSSASEGLGYDRMIRLAYAGSANGTLLATFEHSAGGGAITDYEIQKSTDDGASWSNLSTVPGDVGSLAPFLFEYPQQLGSYPAGTLMLLGDTVTAGNTASAIREWLSFDHGAHWTYVGVVESGGGPGDGVWEPFVMVDKGGNLAMFFSDERQHATYSQFIGEVTSSDGGLTWSNGPGEIKVVASSFPADRPGMPTVATMGLGAGGYALSYEMCGPQACSVHVKISADAETWAGLFLQGTPVITFLNGGGASSGTLYLSGRTEAAASGTVPPNQNVILTNYLDGTGPWSWVPAPAIPTTGAPSACNTNYSPYLLRSANNTQLLYTVAAAAGPYNCEEITAPVTITP